MAFTLNQKAGILGASYISATSGLCFSVLLCICHSLFGQSYL